MDEVTALIDEQNKAICPRGGCPFKEKKGLYSVVGLVVLVLISLEAMGQLSRLQVEQGCGFGSEQSAFRTKDRRDIHLFFGDLVTPQEEELKALSESKEGWRVTSKSSRARVREQVGKLNQLKTERKRLLSLLKQEGKAKIGWIASDLRVRINVAELFKAAELSDTVLKKSGLKPDERKNDLLLFMGILFDVLLNEPLLRGRAKVVVVNSAINADLLELEGSISAENDKRVRELMEAVPRSGLVTSEIEKFADRMTVALFAGERIESDDQAETISKAKTAMANRLKGYRDWVNSVVASFAAAHAQIANEVLGYPGSGALILRSRLSSGVKEALLMTCPKSAK